MSSINAMIKRPHARLFRRAYIKRRLPTTGLYEPTWTEITNDVKSWGSLKTTADVTQYNKFKFSGFRIKVANDQGRYNPEYDGSSLWYQSSSPQRSLVRIEVGYIDQSVGADGIYTNTEYPNSGGTATAAFMGVISGDMPTSDKNEVILPVQPLTEVFRQYPASAIGGYTSTGLTAQGFLENVRDHVDGSGNYIFRPFFGNTSTGFNIASTTVNYTDLNTSGADQVVDANVWDIITDLAQAETKVPYVSKDGVFNFVDRDTNQTASSYSFFGVGFADRSFGHNIKKISKYGFKYSKYYSRVQVKFADLDTSTSYSTTEQSLTVANSSLPWLYGHKTINLENYWIPDQATAQVISDQIFSQVSNLKEEIVFTAPLIPQLEIFDRIDISYDTNFTKAESKWDVNNWAEDAGTTIMQFLSIASAHSSHFVSTTGGLHAFSFTSPSSTNVLEKLHIALRNPNSLTGTFFCYLVEGASITGGTTIGASDPKDITEYGATYSASLLAAPEIIFSSAVTISASLNYWVVANFSNIDFSGGNMSQALSGDTTTSVLPSYFSSNSGTSYTNFASQSFGHYLSGAPAVATVPLIWDKNTGDAIALSGAEFRLLSIENNIDKLETKITARKT